MTTQTLKLPIKGLVARKGDFTVRFSPADDVTPFGVWRGDQWVASFTTRKLAVENMAYRESFKAPAWW